MNNTAVSSATPGAKPMVLLAGRILIGAIFLNAGVRKLLGFAGTVGYFTKLGFPAPRSSPCSRSSSRSAERSC